MMLNKMIEISFAAESHSVSGAKAPKVRTITMELSIVMRKPTIVRCWAEVDTVCERVSGGPDTAGSRSPQVSVAERDMRISCVGGPSHHHHHGGPSQSQDDIVSAQAVTWSLSQQPLKT